MCAGSGNRAVDLRAGRYSVPVPVICTPTPRVSTPGPEERKSLVRTAGIPWALGSDAGVGHGAHRPAQAPPQPHPLGRSPCGRLSPGPAHLRDPPPPALIGLAPHSAALLPEARIREQPGSLPRARSHGTRRNRAWRAVRPAPCGDHGRASLTRCGLPPFPVLRLLLPGGGTAPAWGLSRASGTSRDSVCPQSDGVFLKT